MQICKNRATASLHPPANLNLCIGVPAQQEITTTHRLDWNPEVNAHPSSVLQIGVCGAIIAPRLVLPVPVAHEHTNDFITLCAGTSNAEKGNGQHKIHTGLLCGERLLYLHSSSRVIFFTPRPCFPHHCLTWRRHSHDCQAKHTITSCAFVVRKHTTTVRMWYPAAYRNTASSCCDRIINSTLSRLSRALPVARTPHRPWSASSTHHYRHIR